ncbi:hypothetical protein FTO60_16490 [Octadecabacter sp. SW4]|uniref:flagellar hook-length control protein FliK n=1 Tax=Octadecabacter sp. SW4 TaxID=2602067 RepID=UPI0011C203AC|nr:flagellar hook-length control protein FliK [Octadecabacter sp. SW4]QEE37173.1 hypothetical protein FTO60_16490 [Octadecabacter sp. SW4]
MPILMSDGAFAGASPSATGRNPSQILVASPAERAQITPSFGAAMDDALRTILSKAEAQVADPVEPAAQDKLADPPPDDPPTDEATGVGEAMDRQAALVALPPVAVATPARLPASVDTLERAIIVGDKKSSGQQGGAQVAVQTRAASDPPKTLSGPIIESAITAAPQTATTPPEQTPTVRRPVSGPTSAPQGFLNQTSSQTVDPVMPTDATRGPANSAAEVAAPVDQGQRPTAPMAKDGAQQNASPTPLAQPIRADEPKALLPLASAAPAQAKAQVVMQAEGAVPTPNIAARDAAALTIPATQQVLRVAPAMQAVSTPLSAIQAPEDAPSVTVPTALPSYPATAPASPESQLPNTRRPEAATPDAVNSYVQTNQPPVAWAALDTSLATTTQGDDQTLFGEPLALDSAAGLARIDRPAVAPQPLAPAIAKAVSQQVAVAVTQQSDGQTEIRLNPEELGRVRLALNSSETGITLAIATERPETADLIRRNLDGLAQEFRALGYTDIAFDFAQSDDQPAQDDPKSGDQMVPPSITSAEENSAPVAQSHHATGLDLRL